MAALLMACMVRELETRMFHVSWTGPWPAASWRRQERMWLSNPLRRARSSAKAAG